MYKIILVMLNMMLIRYSSNIKVAETEERLKNIKYIQISICTVRDVRGVKMPLQLTDF